MTWPMPKHYRMLQKVTNRKRSRSEITLKEETHSSNHKYKYEGTHGHGGQKKTSRRSHYEYVRRHDSLQEANGECSALIATSGKVYRAPAHPGKRAQPWGKGLPNFDSEHSNRAPPLTQKDH